MAMDGLRGYLQLVSGLAEMSKARATEAAAALLSLSSGLSSGRSGKNVQVQDLAEELLAAAAANRRSLIALVRGEVERAMDRSPIPPDELDRARAAVAKLSADVEELRAQVLANPAVGELAAKLGLVGHTESRPADEGGPGVASTRPDSVPEGVVVDAAFTGPVDEPVAPAPRRRPPRTQIAGRAATRTVPADAATDAGEALVEPRTEMGAKTEPVVTATPAKKTTPAKRTTRARKTAAKTTAATQAAAKKAATKKAATKKATAKKAATKTTATKSASAKKTAAKKTAAKKAAAKKAAAPSAEAGT